MQNKRESKDKKRITRTEALKVLLGDKRADLKLFKNSTIHIIMARNGAVLVNGEGAAIFMFEADNLKGLRELHYAIDEALGFWGSKHDRQRMRHIIEHGSNYVCVDKDCPICHGDNIY